MNDKVRYLVEMEPNMIKGIALFRLSFERGGSVDYAYASPEGEFLPLDESEWAILPHRKMVEVTEAIVAEWTSNGPVDYNTLATYVV